MIKIEINTPENILEKAYNIANKDRLHYIAFFSTVLGVSKLYDKTGLSEKHLVHDFTEKPKSGEFLNTSFFLPLNSLLFVDFKDKSLYRNEKIDCLDIQHIRSMIIPLKYKYNVKSIYIDNFNKVECTMMGREKLWRTNYSNIARFEDWKERRNEYNMALLYYMSKKFEIDFIIGYELKKEVSNPLKVSDIKFMKFGNSYDMVDKISYYENNEIERILK